MKRFKLTKIAAIAAAAMMMSLSACSGASEGSNSDGSAAPAASGDDTVKVGLLHSLTGSMAISEKAVSDAEKLAIS